MIGVIMIDPLRILVVGATAPDLSTSPWGPFVVAHCATLAEAARALQEESREALLLQLADPAELPRLAQWAPLSHAVLDAAVVVVAPEPPPAQALQLLHLGVQDVLSHHEAQSAVLARALRLAVERMRIDRVARKAFATDLATGLPNHAQLLEHLTHLFALREREPAPMALLALRIEGLAQTELSMGAEAANVLRRKVAVRLRAGLRASDVVAAIGVDTFAVLLAWIDAATDGQRVASKLAASLQRPFGIAGHEQSVAVSLGLGLYPDHGREPDALLRRALAQASSAAAVTGAAGAGGRRALQRGTSAAANDEGD